MGLHTILYVTERDTLKETVQFSRNAYMRCWSTGVGNEAESKIYGPLPGVYTHISGIDSIQVSIIFFLILIVTVSLSKSLRELGPFHKLLLLFLEDMSSFHPLVSVLFPCHPELEDIQFPEWEWSA